jgi:hypothetical protein
MPGPGSIRHQAAPGAVTANIIKTMDTLPIDT